jgi:hypothetical protein
MVRHLFVAEIEAADAVSHVWVQHGRERPRPVRAEDVTETTLETAEFFGASRPAIEAWLKRHAHSV